MTEPGYRFVFENLRRKIISGEYPIGSLIPPEPVLETMFHVSRITVRKAVDLLVGEGFLQKQRGIGTVVLNYENTQNLNTITSLTETLLQRGYNVTVPQMHITRVPAGDKLSVIFGVDKTTPIASVFRLISVSDKPLGIVRNFIPYDLVKGIEEKENRFISLYQMLESTYFMSIEMAQDHIYAKNADAEEAELLMVPQGFALIGLNRRCMNRGKCVIYDTLSIRHDMYSFDISMYERK